MGKPYAKEGPSAEDKALDLFADMMIERIQSLSGKDGWKKPWFTEGALQWPKNLNGREYNGMNAMMLLLHCEKEGYKIPRFCTFDRIQQFNKTGKKDEEQKPRVSVLKGEHSILLHKLPELPGIHSVLPNCLFARYSLRLIIEASTACFSTILMFFPSSGEFFAIICIF